MRLADGVCDGLLCFVRVFGTGVDLELGVLGFAEAGLGKHAIDGALDEEDWAAFADHARGFDFLSADISREAGVDLGVFLSTGEHNLIGIDDDHEVAGVDVGGEGWLVLAAEEAGGFDSDLTEDFALGVDHIPLALDFLGLGGKCLHVLVRRWLRP